MEIHNPFESIYNQLEIINRKLDEIQSLGNNTRPANSEDETLTVNEVCRILKIKPATIYGRTCKNAIPFTKKGKRLVFFRSDIVKYQREGYRPTNDEIEKSNVEELVKNRKRKTH